MAAAGAGQGQVERGGQGLGRRIVTALLVASLVPLALTGIGSWAVFERLLEEKTLEVHGAVVRSHATTVDLYMAERLRALELAAATHELSELEQEGALERLFARLNSTQEEAFVDLGVIDSEGRHVAYIGPHDLRGRSYADAEWFRYVMERGSYVSDVFLGYRRVPHCVIAVRRDEGAARWVLRATLDSDRLDALVRTVQLGETGDAYLVNEGGVYQTRPRVGAVLEEAPIPRPRPHQGVLHRRLELEGQPRQLVTTAWIRQPEWMLVVQQDEREIREPVRRAMLPGVLVVLFACLVVVAATILATRHLVGRIAEGNRERDALSRDLLRSSKLASLGEMSTGLAHEINNPLGIISAERTNISDLVGLMEPKTPDHEELRESLDRIARQVTRCAAITGKMLRFGRHGGGEVQPTSVRPRLEEIVGLLDRQASIRNVDLRLEVEPDLPEAMLDPTELEQVVVNLVNNALQAIEGAGTIVVSARREGGEVVLAVTDDGPGIPPENLERVFQPFFTTKAPGKGTGLGLSVCYGIVTGWGGRIEADSHPGKGTEFTIRVPARAGGVERKREAPR